MISCHTSKKFLLYLT